MKHEHGTFGGLIMKLENQHNQRNLSQCLLPTTCETEYTLLTGQFPV